MITITERAKDALLQLLRSTEPLDLPEVGLRLAAASGGQLGLLPDTVKPGDGVVEHQGSKVLLIGGQLSVALAGTTIDCRPTPRGLEFVLTRPQSQNGGRPY